MKEVIHNSLQEFFQKLDVPIDGITVECELDNSGARCRIETKDSGILIGRDGIHFSALNHLLKKMISKRLGSAEFRLILDVNDYRVGLEEHLKTKATILAERARSLNTEVEMEPMNSYERLLVHTFFQENKPDFKTESRGEGPERRVVIRFLGSI